MMRIKVTFKSCLFTGRDDAGCSWRMQVIDWCTAAGSWSPQFPTSRHQRRTNHAQSTTDRSYATRHHILADIGIVHLLFLSYSFLYIMKGLGWLVALPLCFATSLPGLQEPLVSSDAGKKKLSLTSDLIGFHKNLTQIESISGNEKEVGDWLAASLKSQGYNVEKQYISKDPERFNVLAWPGKNRDAKVMLSSHIDTVSPIHPTMYRYVADVFERSHPSSPTN